MSTRQNYSPLPVSMLQSFIKWAEDQHQLTYRETGPYTFRLVKTSPEAIYLIAYTFNMSQTREHWIGKNEHSKQLIAEYAPPLATTPSTLKPKGEVRYTIYTRDIEKLCEYLLNYEYEFLYESSTKLAYHRKAIKKKLTFNFCQRNSRPCIYTTSPEGNKFLKMFIEETGIEAPVPTPDTRRVLTRKTKPLDMNKYLTPDRLDQFKAFMKDQGFTIEVQANNKIKFYIKKEPTETCSFVYDDIKQAHMPMKNAKVYLRVFNSFNGIRSKLDSLASVHS